MKKKLVGLIIILFVVGIFVGVALLMHQTSEGHQPIARGVGLNAKIGNEVATENQAPTKTAEIAEEKEEEPPTRGYFENIPEDVLK